MLTSDAWSNNWSLAEDGLTTPPSALAWTTLKFVFAGRPVQLTVTGVPVVLLAANATGLPL
jgi:hypothetical protein